MKKLVIIIVIIALAVQLKPVNAQQDPMFSQYMFNNLSFNPAYAGTAGVLSIGAFSRHQWVGFDGAPQTQTFAAHAPLKNGLGLGLFIARDAIGPLNQIDAKANVAYRLELGEKSILSFGIMAGTASANIALQELIRNSFDDMAFQSNINKTKPVVGAGFHWYRPEGFVGISVPDLIETKFETDDITWMHHRHYYLSAGYVWRVHSELYFRPTIMARYVQNAPISAEVSGTFIMGEKIWLGGMYRFDNAIGALVSIQLNRQLRIGYAYDLSLRDVSTYHSGTHEIMLGFDFNFGKEGYMTPRFF
jgi:type IX secretion system PorP/SprF family membrane protein